VIILWLASVLVAWGQVEYAFTNYAGMPGGAGNANGTGGAARFAWPDGVALDGAGNLYVGDGGCIRKVTPGGSVTTLAVTNGTGNVVQFNGCSGLAVDSTGTIYVADSGNHWIPKVTPSGLVTTLAGGGGFGTNDGTGNAARFNRPRGLALDSGGTIYVADSDNHTIRTVTSAGVVRTVAGVAGTSGSVDGAGSAARFKQPYGLAVDSSGNIYVADSGNHTIRKLSSAGEVTTLAGGFNWPHGVAVDSAGNLFIADYYNNAIRAVTSVGAVTTLAGLVGYWSYGNSDGVGSDARFYHPHGLTVDGAGNIYVADFGNFTIRKVTAGGVVTTLAGMASQFGIEDGIGSAARFNGPAGVAVDSGGNLYVADRLNNMIRKVMPGGVVTTLAGAPQFGSDDGFGSAARFTYPVGVAVDSGDNVYVADEYNQIIRKVSPDGMVTTLAGGVGVVGSTDGTGSAARFNYPRGVAVDTAGNVYVADTSNNTIRKVTPTGVVTTLAGKAGQTLESVDGIGSAARFYSPNGVASDSDGNVYVADTGNYTIRKITPAGVVTTLAGTAGSYGTTDGTGQMARFMGPLSLTLDNDGNIYVTEWTTIRRVTPLGLVTTVGGMAGVTTSADGVGVDARFSCAYGVAVDTEGNLFVADTGNNRISKGTRLADSEPQITVQPQDWTGSPGATAFFYVTAMGTKPLTYQWRRYGIDLIDGVQLSGSTNSGVTTTNLTISAVQFSDAGDYTVVVSNAYGSVTSAVAHLTVQWVPDVLPGVVSWWRGEDNALDSVGTNHGILLNGARFTTGISGQAFYFDGVDDVVRVPSAPSLNMPGDHSVEFWFYQTKASLPQHLLAKRTGCTSAIEWNYMVAEDANLGRLPMNRWTHFALVASTTASPHYTRFYTNGVVWHEWLGSQSIIVTNTADLHFATAGTCPLAQTFGGILDEIRLYNRALSSDEVQSLASSPVLGPVITTQPQSRTNIAGTDASFAVVVVGPEPFTYQWQKSGINLTDSGSLSGATSPTLTLSDVQAGDAGDYTVIVSNAYGSVTSSVAVLTVLQTADACGGDDFDDNTVDFTRWGADIYQGVTNGSFLERNTRLEFIGGNAADEHVMARPWICSEGPYTQNWDVAVDAHLGNITLTTASHIDLVLLVAHQQDPNRYGGTSIPGDHFGISLNVQRNTAGTFWRRFRTYFRNNSVLVTSPVEAQTTSQQARLRIGFDAAAKTLTAYHDGVPLSTVDISPAGSDWDMGPNSTFLIALVSSCEDFIADSSHEAWLDSFVVNGTTPAPLLRFVVGAVNQAVSNGVFRVQLAGPANASVVLQASPNLINWTAISTNTLPVGMLPLAWPMGTNRQQFYRARLGP
jgi:hypothetical protein